MGDSAKIHSFRAKLRQELPRLRRDFGVESLGLFGSYVRGDATDSSDLDVLVTFRRTPGLLGFVALQNDLSELLGVEVDLVMKSALRKRIGQRILSETVPI